jgi:acetyl/propionyl-CoA carboxylase alpha subunit
MGQAAVAAARAAGYVNAGTVEFLLEGAGDDARFYFLELNARLQVEHPVSEAVVGVDLVQAQLRVASGQSLPWQQEALTQRGHALECRIYAEDPAQEFLPQAGTILRYREPRGPGVRVDSGVVEGSEVSVYYDPLLAKLIVSAETREAAIRRAVVALEDFVILGITTNVPFLIALLQHPRFLSGEIDTGFLDHELGAICQTVAERAMPAAAIAAAAAHDDAPLTVAPSGAPDARGISGTVDPFVTLRGWRG